MKDLEEILAIARSVGKEAAQLLRSYYQDTSNHNLDVKYKENEPVTAADLAVNRLILEKLQTALGEEDFLYISEETYKSQQVKNKSSQWVWIIDPLDGTRDFIQKTGEYAIHIALVKETQPVLAVVAVPEAEKLYYATKGNGAFVETAQGVLPLQMSSQKKHIEDLTIVVSRSHRNKTLDFLLEQLPCKNYKAVGSVGCKIATIVEQQADVYISISGKSAPKDWDLAAPELILTEAGGKFTHFDTTPLKYNTDDINQWGALLASNGHFHQLLCQQGQTILSNLDFSANY
jgi:3'(2'), 5'-bisphosphate nucleotidase